MATRLDPGTFRVVSANARACIVGAYPDTIADYVAYCGRELERNNRPLDLDEWRNSLRKADDTIRETMRANSHHRSVMPNVTPKRKERLHRLDISDTPIIVGDATDNRPDSLKSDARVTSRITLPIATYLLSEPKHSGIPLISSDGSTVDVKATLMFLMVYRMLCAVSYGKGEEVNS